MYILSYVNCLLILHLLLCLAAVSNALNMELKLLSSRGYLHLLLPVAQSPNYLKTAFKNCWLKAVFGLADGVAAIWAAGMCEAPWWL